MAVDQRYSDPDIDIIFVNKCKMPGCNHWAYLTCSARLFSPKTVTRLRSVYSNLPQSTINVLRNIFRNSLTESCAEKGSTSRGYAPIVPVGWQKNVSTVRLTPWSSSAVEPDEILKGVKWASLCCEPVLLVDNDSRALGVKKQFSTLLPMGWKKYVSNVLLDLGGRLVLR